LIFCTFITHFFIFSKRAPQIVDEIASCDKRQNIKQGGYLTYGILEKQLYEQCRDNVKNEFISNSRNILEQVLALKSF